MNKNDNVKFINIEDYRIRDVFEQLKRYITPHERSCDKYRNKMTDKKLVFVGTIASSVSLKNLNIYNGFLSVENGKVIYISLFHLLQN